MIIEKDNQLFQFSFSPAQFRQLTNFKPGDKAEPSDKPNYLQEQQLALFETLRSTKEKQAAERAFRKQNTDPQRTPFYLNGKNLREMNFSIINEACLFTTSTYQENEATVYPAFITENGYTLAKNARTKVGSTPPSHEMYLTSYRTDTTWQVDFSALSGINKRPAFFADYPDREYEDYEKNLIYHLHGFNEAGTKGLIEIKSYDNKDRWIGYVDSENGTFTELNHQHDEAWIGGPGITGWNMVPGTMGWLDNNQVYYQSEKTGYSHLYLMDCTTQKETALTAGNFEIHDVELSADKKVLYITTNETHPGNRSFYALDIASKKRTSILTKDGNHEVDVSPNGKWLLVNYSAKNKPWELYIAANKENSTLKQITSSQKPAFTAYSWRKPEVVTFKAADSTTIYARIYQPNEKVKNNAAVLFVHGAGYLQNAHNWWSGYYREYMFNNLLCDMGYTVLDIDYRASKGYGRDYRTAIYRWMGGKDLSDHIDGRHYLINKHGIDSSRIGIYGGSYGGFITLMALLTEPGKFACGAAIRSVTDWAHYNHPYTSNILNTPQDDPLAFEKSSPIYFAEGLQDHLLMLHGIVDDNVQYQDVARLSQRFIELGKKNWDLVGYPIQPHGFKETASWVDEYGRILELFESQLNK